MEAKSKSNNQRLIIILLIALILLLAIVLAVVLGRGKTQNISDNATPMIGYADATVILDQDTLQAAMDEAMKNAEDKNVALWYRNEAHSDNGTDFECFVGNSKGNAYDMFLTIYADAEMTDQVFLSGLVPPGSGFENISLDHALPSGVNTVYVAVTLVDTEEDGTQVIKSQVIHTMDFHVSD